MTADDLASRVRLVLETGLESVSARACIERAMRDPVVVGWLADAATRPLDVIAVGKASAEMTREFLDRSDGGRDVARALVVSAAGTERMSIGRPGIEQRWSEHPLPGPGGVEASARVEEWVLGGTGRDLVFLLSGGASSLLPAPAQGFFLQDKIVWSERLMRAGADIHQLNAVRTQMSRFKGGRLAARSGYERVLVLVLSDVVGDDLAVVGSGPWHPSSRGSSSDARATAAEIVQTLLGEEFPEEARSFAARLERSADPPPADDPCFARVRHVMCGSGTTALDAMERTVKIDSGRARIESWGAAVVGEAREVAARLVRSALEGAAAARVSVGSCRPLATAPPPSWLGLGAGETTVTVRGDGLGGRNQELALAFALEWERQASSGTLQRFVFASLGTDGRDGPTAAAGALVDHATLAALRAAGIDPQSALHRNDSHRALDAVRATIDTGPTGTNVGDLMVCAVE